MNFKETVQLINIEKNEEQIIYNTVNSPDETTVNVFPTSLVLFPLHFQSFEIITVFFHLTFFKVKSKTANSDAYRYQSRQAK